MRFSKYAGIDGLGGAALDDVEIVLATDLTGTRFLAGKMYLRALVSLFHILEPFSVL